MLVPLLALALVCAFVGAVSAARFLLAVALVLVVLALVVH